MRSLGSMIGVGNCFFPINRFLVSLTREGARKSSLGAGLPFGDALSRDIAEQWALIYG